MFRSLFSRPYFTVSSETPPTWRAGPCIYIPQEQGGPVIPPGTGFPFVASYGSHGSGGGILTRLHTGSELQCRLVLNIKHRLPTDTPLLHHVDMFAWLVRSVISYLLVIV
jgi:hypothetical protein